MPAATFCNFGSRRIGIAEAIRLRDDAFKDGRPGPGFTCTACSRPVRPHKGGGHTPAHFEHLNRNKACMLSHKLTPRGDRGDGVKSSEMGLGSSNKVLWVKFGWSDYYRGGPVDGNFAWLSQNKDKKNLGRGHEAFNFKPSGDGTYFCYVPPQGRGGAPRSSDPKGWTVICLAKDPKRRGIHIVGWYENATLEGQWRDPPSEFVEKRGDTDHPAYDWSYCITSKEAYFVPPELRVDPFSDSSIRQAKYSYLKGPGVKATASKKRVLALLESRLMTLKKHAVRNPSEAVLPDPETNSCDPLCGFGTAEHRKNVEEAAERVVMKHYKGMGFKCERVTHLPCGHDFVFSAGQQIFHVEVKGTASDVPQFFLTKNEHNIGLRSNPRWRLAMVTSALRDPKLIVYSAKELEDAFQLAPYVYMAKLLPTGVDEAS